MATNNGDSDPQTSRKFTAVLENGKTVVMITMSPMTRREAGRVIRQKLRMGGKLVV